MTLTVFTHTDFELHNMGDGHPESPLRLASIRQSLEALPSDELIFNDSAPVADIEQLKQTHQAAYIDNLVEKDGWLVLRVKEGEVDPEVQLDPDTAMMQHTWIAARRAAGAGIAAVDRVLDEKAKGNKSRAFCAVRPPGHHALRDGAMGFCVLGNIAIAAHHALNNWGLKRVVIVDFDVHHGNGTENIVEGDERIRLYSSYQANYYPFPDISAAKPNVIHTPLQRGSDGAVFREALTPWFADIDAFAPELILVSAGFDAHAEDPLAQIKLHESDYTWITEELVKLADKHCGGRIVSMLEGGYNLSALGRSVVAHIKALIEN